MDGIETTSLWIGSTVGLLTLASAIWISAVSMNNRQRDIGFMKEELITIKDSLVEINKCVKDKDDRLDKVERTLEDVLQEMVKLVYINSDHILLEAYDGRVVKIPIM